MLLTQGCFYNFFFRNSANAKQCSWRFKGFFYGHFTLVLLQIQRLFKCNIVIIIYLILFKIQHTHQHVDGSLCHLSGTCGIIWPSNTFFRIGVYKIPKSSTWHCDSCIIIVVGLASMIVLFFLLCSLSSLNFILCIARLQNSPFNCFSFTFGPYVFITFYFILE